MVGREGEGREGVRRGRKGKGGKGRRWGLPPLQIISGYVTAQYGIKNFVGSCLGRYYVILDT